MLHAICSIEWLFCIDHWTKVSPLSMKWTAIYRDNWIKSHVSPFKHLVCHDLIYISIHHMKIISFCFVSPFFPRRRRTRSEKIITEIITKCSHLIDAMRKLFEWSWWPGDFGSRSKLAQWLLSVLRVWWPTVTLVLWEGWITILSRWLFTTIRRSMPTMFDSNQWTSYDCGRA